MEFLSPPGAPSARNRRSFLRLLASAIAATATHRSFASLPIPDTDEDIFQRIARWTEDEKLALLPIGEVIAALGRHFRGTPYVAHSLEVPGPEQLVVNLRGFDCLTLVENCLCLARCVKLQQMTFVDFQKQLTLVRYTGGVIDGYPSRLHYFTEWMRDNESKRVVREVTAELGGKSYQKSINFMSTHRESYPQLADDAYLQRISAMEERLSSSSLISVPKERIERIHGALRSGDLVGTVTSMEGMDVSHSGMVVRTEGTVRFLHAPLSGGATTMSTSSLAGYVSAISRNTGIVIARPLEPAG